jgi:hypothetical protein
MEAVLSRFMRAYATDGGFSISWAGISTKRLGLPDHSKAERQAFFEDTITWIKANTPLDQNAKTELGRRKAYNQRRLDEVRSEQLAKIDKVKAEKQLGVDMAIQAHKLVEGVRQQRAASDPQLVEKVDRNYEIALEAKRLEQRRDQL